MHVLYIYIYACICDHIVCICVYRTVPPNSWLLKNAAPVAGLDPRPPQSSPLEECDPPIPAPG